MEFFTEYKNELGKRYHTFNLMFNILNDKGEPTNIIETGCIRKKGNFRDGQSTLLFGRFIQEETGGTLETIDVSKSNMDVCKGVTKEYRSNIIYTVGDSVEALSKMSDERIFHTDLFYLDSFDLSLKNPKPSMMHHKKELLAIFSRINNESLIVVDDNTPEVGKGKYVYDYLLANGWVLLNSDKDYQWVFGFGGFSEEYNEYRI